MLRDELLTVFHLPMQAIAQVAEVLGTLLNLAGNAAAEVLPCHRLRRRRGGRRALQRVRASGRRDRRHHRRHLRPSALLLMRGLARISGGAAGVGPGPASSRPEEGSHRSDALLGGLSGRAPENANLEIS